jgi:Flp pilus assembly protein TadG
MPGIRRSIDFAVEAFAGLYRCRAPRALVRRCLRNESGTVALIFALALVPILLAMGMAVDYGMVIKEKTALDSYADATALLAVSRSDIALLDQDAQKDAKTFFKKQAKTNGDYNSLQSVSVKVKDSSSGRTANVTYQAIVPTAFMKLVGIDTVKFSGTSSAASTLPNYIDFYLLLDNSPSMGVGATTADIDKMVANTPDQCAFACHDTSNPNNYYNLAKDLDVETRIGVMREATQQLMDTATNTEFVPEQFRMAIYTFGASADKKGLTTIQDLTPDLSAAKGAAAAIDLMTVPYQNYADDTDTDFGATLTKLNSIIPNPGTGTQTAPLKYVFFVSDGVEDRAVGSPGCDQPITNGSDPSTGKSYVRCQQPLNLSFCTALKNRGINIAVLYTTYLPLPTNDWYNTWISPFSSQIATKMENCASPGLYFEVSPSEGISEAMTALFQKVIQHVRLTH